ncbi:MAG TPA: hypothetical protein VFZ58_03165 [Candidatus Saccharimonadales bacterium]
MKQLAKTLFLATITLAAVLSLVFIQTSPAQASCTPSATQKCCGDVPITIDVGCKDGEVAAEGLALAYIYAIIRVMTGIVGAGVVGTIIFGGLTYMTARDNAGQAEKGIKIIRTAIIALIFFIFSATLISFLIPGGLFSNV